ncbi:MAG: leucyl aminopeptidase, partial [Beijerinckiaceae bacterium]|nr:leucyl aminopeptidase [Beijerinckiaceae bacterium]
MSSALKVTIANLDEAFGDVLVVLVGKDGKLGPEAAKRLGKAGAARIAAAAEAESFTGKPGSTLSLPAETGFREKTTHLVLIGTETAESQKADFLKLGGQIQAKLPKGRHASILAAGPDGPIAPDAVAGLALGMKLAAYRFDRYQTQKKGDDAEAPGASTVTLLAENAATARRELKTQDAIFSGVTLARDLVNEPPNILTPTEFASRAAALEKLGVEIDILDEKALKKLGMRAL